MTDHETFVLLAAKQITKPLSAKEEGDLASHLAECPPCRSIAAGMRRDDIRLRAELGVAKVAPRVRRRVLDEATRRRPIDGRLLLGLAAALLLGAIGVPMIAGGWAERVPSSSATADLPTLAPSSSSRSVSIASPSVEALAESPSPTRLGPFVAGAYTYGEHPPRRDTVAAQFEGGEPAGEWSRITPATGDGETYGGPVTCLVISGSDAWLAGPATTSTDGSKDRAAMIHVHDGGPEGQDDAVVLWLTPPGQTLETVTNWCEHRFIPAGPFPLTAGDVVVRDDP